MDLNSHKSRQTASAGTLRFGASHANSACKTVICRLEQADAQPIAVKPHLSTTEELKNELAAMRETPPVSGKSRACV